MLPGKDFFSLADIQIQIVCRRGIFDKIARYYDILAGNKKARSSGLSYMACNRPIFFSFFS